MPKAVRTATSVLGKPSAGRRPSGPVPVQGSALAGDVAVDQEFRFADRAGYGFAEGEIGEAVAARQDKSLSRTAPPIASRSSSPPCRRRTLPRILRPCPRPELLPSNGRRYAAQATAAKKDPSPHLELPHRLLRWVRSAPCRPPAPHEIDRGVPDARRILGSA